MVRGEDCYMQLTGGLVWLSYGPVNVERVVEQRKLYGS